MNAVTMMKRVGLAFLVTLMGCSASWVSRDFQTRKGVLSYQQDGALVTDARRGRAMTMAREFCGGDFDVLSEQVATSVDGVVTTSSTDVDRHTTTQVSEPITSNHITVAIQCRLPGAQASR